MRYLLDENLPERVARLLRERGLDVTHVREYDRQGLSDEEQLAFAAAEGRVLVTQDLGDFDEITERFWHEAQPHEGIAFLPTSIGTDDFGGIAGAIQRFDREREWPLQPYESAWLSRGAR